MKTPAERRLEAMREAIHRNEAEERAELERLVEKPKKKRRSRRPRPEETA